MDIDVSLSRLSPQYRILTKEEVNELLLKYKVVYRDLPKIKLTDPAVKMLNASEEDVIEITRKSLTAGESKYYRLVVK